MRTMSVGEHFPNIKARRDFFITTKRNFESFANFSSDRCEVFFFLLQSKLSMHNNIVKSIKP